MDKVVDFGNIDGVKKVASQIGKKESLFSSLSQINDKETMKWILVKFLKESLDFLADSPEARKTQRGKLVENWIDENLQSLSGEYDNPKEPSSGFGIF